MKERIAYLFPGQGAQYSGMAMDLLESNAVKSIFNTASEVFGMDVKELLQSDSETLKRTDFSQSAITTANLAAFSFLNEQGFSPVVCAGFSLGEYAALVCAGVLDITDCFRLVKKRGEAMQMAIDKIREAAGSSSAPGMAAVIGLPPLQIEELVNQWSAEGLKDLYTANINSPRQTVVSGTAAALAEAESRFKEAGAKHVIPLQVSGPFHSPLMSDAVEVFLPALNEVVFRDPVIPVFSNVTGLKISSGEEAKKLAIRQITSPVRWVEEEENIFNLGIDICFEAGPGKVLQGLWRDIKKNVTCVSAGTAEDIMKLKNRNNQE